MKPTRFERASPSSQDQIEATQLTTPLFAPLVMGRQLGFAVSAKPGLLGVSQVTRVIENVVRTGCGLEIGLQVWLLEHKSGFVISDVIATGYKPDEADIIIRRLEEIGYIEETARPESNDASQMWTLSSRGREVVRGYSFDESHTSIQ